MAKIKRKCGRSRHACNCRCQRSPRIAASRSQARPHVRRSGSDRIDRGSDPRWRWLVPTGITELDARLDGGLPRGHLSEVIGPRSSGRLAILVSALAGATRGAKRWRSIDPLDMFDPVIGVGQRGRLSADVVDSRRIVQFCARQPLVRIRHAAEEPRPRGQGAEHRPAGRRALDWWCSIWARSPRRRLSGCPIPRGCACTASSKAAKRRAC